MANDDQTVQFLRDQLDLPAAPPDPSPPPAPAPRPPMGEPPRRGGGALWLVVALVAVVGFVAGAYFVVDQAEQDRPRGTDVSIPPTEASDATTTAPPGTEAPPATQDPASLSVAVLNGTPQRGWAAENGDLLDAVGYETARTDALTDDVATTTVYIARPELAPDGAAVAETIGFPDAPVEARPEEPLSADPGVADSDVVVVLGADSLP